MLKDINLDFIKEEILNQISKLANKIFFQMLYRLLVINIILAI